MKTRLIIASLSVLTVATTLAVVTRSTAFALEERPEHPDSERAEATSELEVQGIESNDLESADLTGAEGEAAVEVISDLGSEDEAPLVADEEDAVIEPALVESDQDEPMVFHIESFEAEEADDRVRRNEERADTLTVDFPDEEIRAILRVVADLFDLNLVIPQELTGRASITLRNVTWRQVFDVVLSPVGFTYIEEGNIIKVVSLESLTTEPPLTRVMILNYAQADNVARTVGPMVDQAKGGRIQVDTRSNALVITERPTQLRRIENIIEDLDKPNVQVMIESKFIETRNRHQENKGVDWASLDGWGIRAGELQHEFRRERNVESNETTRGFDSDTSRITTAVFSADQFNLVLSAMRQDNHVKLVSNPTVVTMNNHKAEIHIGEEFPIVLPRFNPQTGTYEAGEYNTIDIGIKLDVTPQVNNAGFITLNVQPDVSTLQETVSYFGAEYPVRSTRRTSSQVTIKDGFTLAIGGLVTDDILDIERRVPVLGSVPGIGRLFRSNSKDNDQRNLIIFLTARTLNPDGGTLQESVDSHMFHRMGLTRDDVPGQRPSIPLWIEEEPEVEETSLEEEAVETEPEVTAEAETETEPELAAEEQVDVTLIGTIETDDPSVQVELISAEELEAGASEEAPEAPEAEEAAEEAETEVEVIEAEEVSTLEFEEQPVQQAPRSRGGWLTPSR